MEPVKALSMQNLRKPTPQNSWNHNREEDQNQWEQDIQNDQPLCFTLERKPEKTAFALTFPLLSLAKL
jgi:hypothetical protein